MATWNADLFSHMTAERGDARSCDLRIVAKAWAMNRCVDNACPYCGTAIWSPDMVAFDHRAGDGAADKANGNKSPIDEIVSLYSSFASPRGGKDKALGRFVKRTESEAAAVFDAKYRLICANCNNVKFTRSEAYLIGKLREARRLGLVANVGPLVSQAD